MFNVNTIKKGVNYLFGFLSLEISSTKQPKKFHYLQEDLLCGDGISTIFKIDEGLKIILNDTVSILHVKSQSCSINWILFSFTDEKSDGFITSKDDILNNKEAYKLNGKWKNIVCFTHNTFLGISKDLDLFNIEIDVVPIVTRVIFPSKLKIDSVVCGSDHSLILSSGRVMSKGLGSRGQLGHGNLENATEFKEVTQLGNIVSQISCGLWHSVALTEAGDVYCWGWNESGQLGVPCFTSKEILATSFENIDDLEEPNTIHTEPFMVSFPINDWNIIKIDCGSRHTVCLNDDGRVFAFGWGAMGQLGREDGLSYDYPIQIEDFAATDIRCTQWGTVITVPPHPGAVLE